MAPEVLAGCCCDSGNGAAAADVWSCGVVLFAMVCGAYPYGPLGAAGAGAGATAAAALARLARPDDAVPPGAALSAGCRDLLRRLLAVDARARATVPEIIAHPWFAQNLPPRAALMNDAYVAATPAAAAAAAATAGAAAGAAGAQAPDAARALLAALRAAPAPAACGKGGGAAAGVAARCAELAA